jgi:hypothetical protein
MIKIDSKLYKRVQKITLTNYDPLIFKKEDSEELILDESKLYSIIEDLICEYDKLEEELEDTIADRNDN